MNLRAKGYLWTAGAGLVAYVAGLAQILHDFHPVTTVQKLTAILLALLPAAAVCTLLNLKSTTLHKKKYVSRFAGGLGAYVLGLDLANQFHAESGPYNYLVIILPILPLIYVSSVIIRYIAESDEMWRKIYMEAWAFSGVATGFTCFSYLFLRGMGGPEFHAQWAFYMMWIYYGIGLFFSWRRYA